MSSGNRPREQKGARKTGLLEHLEATGAAGQRTMSGSLKLWSRAFVRGRRGGAGTGAGSSNGSAGGRWKRRRVSVQHRPRQQRAGMPGAGGLCTSAARHRHRGRVPCRHITGALAGRRCTPRRRSVPALPRITGALAGRRCKPWRRSVPALPLLICFARRCRQPKLPGSASAVVVLIVAATLTDIPMPCIALALGPLGAGKGGFQLRGPRSYSTRRSAGWPAPTRGAGTAASPGCAAARRRR